MNILEFTKEGIGWGFLLWLFGYVLGLVFFFFVPEPYLGWLIMPFGITATVWVLSKKTSLEKVSNQMMLALVWTALAIALDYIFIVRMLHPADGYYNTSVFGYYALTFILPFVVGTMRRRHDQSSKTVGRQ